MAIGSLVSPALSQTRSHLPRATSLKMAIFHHTFPLEVNVDSLEVVHILRKDNHECRSLMETMERIAVEHVFREQNQLADTLSKEAVTRDVGDQLCFLLSPPNNMLKVFWADYFGTQYKRTISDCNLRAKSINRFPGKSPCTRGIMPS